MAGKSKARGTFRLTWDVKANARKGDRHFRTDERPRNSRELNCAETQNVTAARSIHLPKRTIARNAELEWLEEPDEADLA